MNSTKLRASISQAADILKTKQRVALIAHTNPDGDTLGASVALCIVLRALGKVCHVYCDSSFDKKLGVFERLSDIKHGVFCQQYDLLVAVDCGDIFRTGEYSGEFNAFSETMTVDHHGGEFYSKYNCLFNYASTCQIVYEICKELQMEIDGDLATYLYMGLCTDTGNFANTNTDSASFLMASHLVECGADIQKVYRVFFRDTTLAETKLVAKVLSQMRTYYDNQLAVLFVTKNDLDALGLDLTATSGLVRFAIDVDTVKVGVCISEYTNENYKVSMRSKGVDVRSVCREFGGGGHKVAAGCMIRGMLEDVIEKIVRVVGYSL